MEARGEQVVLPEIPATYLIEWWMEIGPTVSTGMGDAPIGWPDIAAWQRLTGIRPEPWETRLIRQLSQEFLSQRSMSRKPSCLSPLAEAEAARAEELVTAQFAAMMAAFSRPSEA